MNFEEFTANDLVYLPEIEPPGWGSLSPRFLKFIQSEHCFPVKLTEGNQLIGIGTTICHEDSAWLACIIVHPDHRNKGLGNLITDFLIKSLDKERFQTIYLIATDLGFPVYKKLGFELETEYFHFKNEEYIPESSLASEIVSFSDEYRNNFLILDRLITGENRINTLNEHLKTSLLYVQDKKILGYYMPSLGEGQILASTKEAGIELMKARLQNAKLAIFPIDNVVAQALVESLGFLKYASSRRMFLGKRRHWKAAAFFNRIGGHLG